MAALISGRRDALGLAVVLALFVVGVLALPSSQAPFALAGLVALVAAAVLFEVTLPWGGTVAMGHAIVIAFAGRLSVADFIVVIGLALAVVTLPELRRYGVTRGALVMGVLVCSASAALAGRVAGNAIVATLSLDDRSAVVVPVVLAGIAYLTVVVVGQIVLPSIGGRPTGWRSALSIYVSLLCAATLLALASERNTALGAVALVPLLVLRYSFHEYFEARRTYLQTTQALSMIPEVAGLTPLGHGERTAVYAAALAEWLGFTPPRVDLVATVARLHHIGQIAHPELPDRPFGPEPEEVRRIGAAGAEILAGTGFLRDVAPIVAAVQGGDSESITSVEAVVRVASTLDDLVGQDPTGLPDALISVLARHGHGLERTMALSLAQLCHARPGLAFQACAAGATVATPGVGLGLAGIDR